MSCLQILLRDVRTQQLQNGIAAFQIMQYCNQQLISTRTFCRSVALHTWVTRTYFRKCFRCSMGLLNQSVHLQNSLKYVGGSMSCVHHKYNLCLSSNSFHTSPTKAEWPTCITSACDTWMTDNWKNCSSYGQLRTNSTVSERKTAGVLHNSRTFTLSAKGIVEASPVSLQPYLRLIRLDRPIGTWLTFLPSVWSLSLAAPAGQLPDMKLISLFALGAFFMRSAGCTINDMFDRDFDAQVARTKNRPIAGGEITRLKALVFLGLPLSASLGILLTLNDFTIILGMCAVLPVAAYPLMKRVTYWPQAFLGLTFNYGVLMGWSAVRGTLEWPVLPLYAACIAWTLVYDTIYAFQDRNDDIAAGVKSTALRFGDQTKLWLAGFTAILTTGITTTGLMCNQPWPYFVGVSLFTAHLAHQIYTVNLSSPGDCGAKFRSNRNIGLVFWLAVVVAGLLGVNNKSQPDDHRVASDDQLKEVSG